MNRDEFRKKTDAFANKLLTFAEKQEEPEPVIVLGIIRACAFVYHLLWTEFGDVESNIFSNLLLKSYEEFLRLKGEENVKANDSRTSDRTDDQGKPAVPKRAEKRKSPAKRRGNGAKRQPAAGAPARKSAVRKPRGRK